MIVDLHSHSNASDGSDTPTRLVELASETGVSMLALTDHDTQAGVAEALEASRTSSVEVIPGVELSLEHDGGGMHLLALWLTPGDGPLQEQLEDLREGRELRNARIVEILTDAGMPLGLDEVRDEAGGGSVGRPHIAAVMVGHGYVPDIKTAFDLWLGNGRPAYVGRPRMTPEEAIGLARESGAVPVLAHPHTLGITTAVEMGDLLERLSDAGLIGLEALYAGYRRHEREGYSDLARRFGLVVSGGSDYHGSYKPGLALGIGYGDLSVPERVTERLREYATQ